MKLAYFGISKTVKKWSAQFIDTEITAAVDKYFPLWKVPNLTYLYLQPQEGWCIYLFIILTAEVIITVNVQNHNSHPNHKNLLFSSYQLGFCDTNLKLNQSKLQHQKCLSCVKSITQMVIQMKTFETSCWWSFIQAIKARTILNSGDRQHHTKLLNTCYWNGGVLKHFINKQFFRITLYSMINSATWKHCSIAFIWMVTH